MPCDLGVQPGFCIGPVPVRFYGIIIVTAALVGGLIATREARRLGENTERIWDALLFVVIAGIIGARLYHVFSTPAGCSENVPMCGWPWYRDHPLNALFIWNGGLGIFGAILGGLIVVLLYVRHYKLSLARYLDIAAPALIMAQAIGRWGNFINQEMYGPPTDLPWGIPIDELHRYGDFRGRKWRPGALAFILLLVWGVLGGTPVAFERSAFEKEIQSTDVEFRNGTTILRATILHPEAAGPRPGIVILGGRRAGSQK